MQENLALTINTSFKEEELELLSKCLIKRLLPDQKMMIEELSQKEGLQDFEYLIELIKTNNLSIKINMHTQDNQFEAWN